MRGGGSSSQRAGNKRWLNPRQLYKEDIDIELDDEFIERLNNSDWLRNLKLPLMFYSESRGSHSALNTFKIVYQNGGQNEVKFQHGRELISEDHCIWMKKSEFDHDLYIAKNRGLTLHYWVQIEYLIKVLVCIKLKAFANKEVEALAEKTLESGRGMFGSIERQIEFLHKNPDNYLVNSHSYLLQLKKIRNNLAHTYLPSYLVDEAYLIDPKEDEIDAITRIFNNTWFQLIKDFANMQSDLVVMIDYRLKAENKGE